MQNGPNSGFYSPSQAAQLLGLSKRRVLQLLTSDPPELAGTKDSRGRWLIARADLFALQERRERYQRERPEQAPPSHPDPELVEVLREQVEDLRGRLDVADQRDREQRRIIAALTSRLPELPSAPVQHDTSSESTGGPQSPDPISTPPEPPAGPQTGAQAPQTVTRRPWWRRVLRS